jgi:hypothetical protein
MSIDLIGGLDGARRLVDTGDLAAAGCEIGGFDALLGLSKASTETATTAARRISPRAGRTRRVR